MSDEIIHTSEYPSYHRRPDETLEKYEMFTEWCRIPMSSRSLANFSRRTGVPPKLARRLHEEWKWEQRSNSFDNDSLMLRPDPRSIDEEVAIAGQLAAATILIDLGMTSIQLKNPSQLSADKAIRLVEKGVEIQRRALGQADMNVQFTVEDMTRVNRMLDEVMGEEAEVVEEIDIEGDDEADLPY